MAQMIADISSFNTSVLLPFVENFFTGTLGLFFVGIVAVCVVLRGLAALVKTRF